MLNDYGVEKVAMLYLVIYVFHIKNQYMFYIRIFIVYKMYLLSIKCIYCVYKY